ncbi:MAG: DNA-processing protein DprA [Patescibacteria group bacterium]
MQSVSLSDKTYPRLLSKIKNPPETLYYLGDWDQKIFENCLAVVGTRKITDYGREMVDRLVLPLASAGVTIVSGFMYGVDASAHWACLDSGGRTIAILGCGIDLIRPTIHRDLHQRILQNKGLVISEYQGDHPSFRWTFVRRNRIVSGISKAVLVVEAGEKSGALITAACALEQKRKVLVVPGPVTSSVSRGNFELLKLGATPVSSAEEILLEMGISCVKSKILTRTKPDNLTIEEQAIFKLLADQRLTIDELARQSAKSSAEIGSCLSMMLMKRLVQERGGKYFVN